MKKRVKNTTFDWILDLLFPCYCKRCGKSGDAFCPCCIFDMQRENPPFCHIFDADFDKIIGCGLRKGVLLEMISEYKFLSRRHYAEAFSEILGMALGKFCRGEKYILVPLPTIRRHIRGRGFDHIKLICNKLAARNDFLVCPVLVRRNNTVQVGASAEVRRKQASEAYEIDVLEVKKAIESGEKMNFLLVDDVWTTGSSMRAAREALFKGLLECGLESRDIKISAIFIAKNGGYEFS